VETDSDAFDLVVSLPSTVSVPFPSDEAPSKNSTSPAFPATPETTVAVTVTDWPTVDGFGVVATAVVVGVFFTVWSTVAVLPPA
jgi:hypothetical protein